MKKNVAVFYGGRTAEHDVSIVTGLQLMENADTSKYELIPIYISREGNWYTGDKVRDTNFLQHFDEHDKGVKRVFMDADAGNHTLFLAGRKAKPLCEIDIALPAMHGLHGEDGTIQGLFELKDIPYTSSGVTGSGVGMDKIIMKAAFAGLGFPVLPMVFFERRDWKAKREACIAQVEEKLSYPVFVKPANLGSSIGISRACNQEEFIQAVEIAANYDKRILVERAAREVQEVNCSVLGIGSDAAASVTEEPVTWKEFLTFDEKYLRGATSKGMKSLDRKVPADLTKEQEARIKEISLGIFRGLDLKGVVRIDFIVEKETGEIFVNEVNTIPGSFAFYLWEPCGLPYKLLIDKLIDLAEQQMREKQKNNYAFNSNILQKAGKGSKMVK